jgi:hypothetical protein
MPHAISPKPHGNKGASGALMIANLEWGCGSGNSLLQEPNGGFVGGTAVEMSGCPHLHGSLLHGHRQPVGCSGSKTRRRNINRSTRASTGRSRCSATSCVACIEVVQVLVFPRGHEGPCKFMISRARPDPKLTLTAVNFERPLPNYTAFARSSHARSPPEERARMRNRMP